MEDKTFEQEVIDKIAHKIVERRLSVPAVLFLEVIKPISFFGAQTMNFFGPLIESFLKKENRYYDVTEILEDRNNIERILRRVEELENDISLKEKSKPGRKQKKHKHHTLKAED